MPAKDVTVPSTLKGEAKKVWLKIYQAAWDSYDPKKSKAESREAYAASVAWAGLKRAGFKKGEKGDWVKKSLALPNVSFRLRVTKAKHDEDTGKIRWHAQAANDELEDQDEALDPSLFTDLAENFQAIMVSYANNQTPPDFGHGPAQIPILDVSHYSALLPMDERNEARVGNITKLYRDGRYLHADGYFDDTKIGQLAAKSIMEDEEGILRTSVGFYPDWGNIEVRNDILIFKGGRKKAYLDHIAITSVPLIRSTTIEVEGEVTMSEATSMAEDALAVLGDESVVKGLEQLVGGEPRTESMVLRSEEGDVEEVENKVVNTVKVESEDIDQEIERAAEYIDAVVEKEESTESSDIIENTVEDEVVLESQVVEADVGGPDKCVCPECNYSTDKVRGTPCRDMTCPKCDAGLVAGGSKEKSEAAEKEIKLESEIEEEVVEEAEVVIEEVQTESEIAVDVPGEVQLPYGGATSFEGAIEYQQAIDEKWRVEDGWWLLRTVIDNIMSSNVEDPKAVIAAALSQYTAFLESGESLMSETEEPEKTPEIVMDGGEPTVEDLPGAEVEEISPVTLEPPEAQPMSVVKPEAMLGHRAVTSFGDALAKLGKMDIPVPRKQAAVAELTQIAESEIQRELVNDANVGELVATAVEQAMSSVGTELAQIRELLTQQSIPGSQGQTPQRPERKSYKPNIQPAAVTTRARTFSDVIERLLS